jgi:hypothetical protein
VAPLLLLKITAELGLRNKKRNDIYFRVTGGLTLGAIDLHTLDLQRKYVS